MFRPTAAGPGSRPSASASGSWTVGLPFGPERLQAEAVGVKDVLATWDEVWLAALVTTLLLSAVARPAPRWSVACAWGLAAASLVAALVAGSH